jgi:hypothetical protein
VRKADRISGSDTIRDRQVVIGKGEKQIALLTVFGADRSAVLADLHLVSARRAGEPILRLVLHVALLTPLMHEVNFGRRLVENRHRADSRRSQENLKLSDSWFI